LIVFLPYLSFNKDDDGITSMPTILHMMETIKPKDRLLAIDTIKSYGEGIIFLEINGQLHIDNMDKYDYLRSNEILVVRLS
jgi:hypothetical protein